MSQHTNDNLLITAICGGDQDALGALYDRYSSVLMAVGLRFLHDRPLIEDVLHDVFLEVYKSAHSFDPSRGSVRTWLIIRMRCRTLDRLRKTKRASETSLHEIDSTSNGEHFWVSNDDPSFNTYKGQIRSLVMNLPRRHRDILLMSYFRGLTIDEISDSIDIPPGTVKSRLFTARSTLRAVWKSAPGESP